MVERETVGPDDSFGQRSATSSMDAFPQMPQLAVATNARSGTRSASRLCARRTGDLVLGLSHPGWVTRNEGHAGKVTRIDDALADQEAGRQLVLLARRAHRDRDVDRRLLEAGGADPRAVPPR